MTVDQLKIGAGERAAIIGPSGCGKTTLLSAISGILVPTAGSVTVGETDVSQLGEKERRAFRC
ncbi:MAG: ABC transporter ATP-binding protein, partial [Planctomycetia bacterium TMED53]